jgi:hypothetical protein
MYHKTIAPAGVIVRDEADMDEKEANGWVTTPALFNTTPSPMPEPVNVIADPPTIMSAVVEEAATEPEIVPEPEPILNKRDEARETMFTCDVPNCGREFGSNVALLAHKRAGHKQTLKNKKR